MGLSFNCGGRAAASGQSTWPSMIFARRGFVTSPGLRRSFPPVLVSGLNCSPWSLSCLPARVCGCPSSAAFRSARIRLLTSFCRVLCCWGRKGCTFSNVHSAFGTNIVGIANEQTTILLVYCYWNNHHEFLEVLYTPCQEGRGQPCPTTSLR